MGLSATVRVATNQPLPNYAAEAGTTRLRSVTLAAFPAIDDVALREGDSLLVKDEHAGLANGIYILTSLGSPTANWVLQRRGDLRANDDLAFGGMVGVTEGSRNAGTQWLMTPIAGTAGTVPMSFTRTGSTPIMLGNTPASERATLTVHVKGAEVSHNNGVGTIDMARTDLREYLRPLLAIGTTREEANVLAFENALFDLGKQGGGELFVPAGIYSMPRGVRVPWIIDTDGTRWARAATHLGGGEVFVAGREIAKDFYILEITAVNGTRPSQYKWSKEAHLPDSWTTRDVTPVAVGQDEKSTLNNRGELQVRFAATRTFAVGELYCWIGNGLGIVPRNTLIRGAGTERTILEFSFGDGDGTGDAFCFGFETKIQAARNSGICDLTIENTSRTNHLDVCSPANDPTDAVDEDFQRSRQNSPVIKTDRIVLENSNDIWSVIGEKGVKPVCAPLRPDYDVELNVVGHDEFEGRKLPVFRYRTGWRRDGNEFVKDWFNDLIHLKDHVVPLKIQDPRGVAAYLPGTGLRIICPEGEYNANRLSDGMGGDTYQSRTIGYDGSAIVVYGASHLKFERVMICGFSRGVSLHACNLADISSCLFRPVPRGGGAIAQEVIDAEICVGIIISQYVHNIRSAVSQLPNGDPKIPFNLSGGQSNIHNIEDCDFGRLAIGIWHEDGSNHTVRRCKFESTIASSELGSTLSVLYEQCYYEGVGHCNEVERVDKDIRDDFLPQRSFRGSVFNMSGGGLAPTSAVQFLVKSCYINPHFGIPLFKLSNKSQMDLTFENNISTAERVAEKHLGLQNHLPVVEIGDHADFQTKNWDCLLELGVPISDRSLAGFNIRKPSRSKLGGLGIGTMEPQANLHVRAWAGTEAIFVPTSAFLPVFKFETAAALLNGQHRSFSLSPDLRQFSHVTQSDGSRRNGHFSDVVSVRTDAAQLPRSIVFEWPMMRMESAHIEVIAIAMRNGGEFVGYWKKRAIARKLNGEPAFFGAQSGGQNVQTLDQVVTDETSPTLQLTIEPTHEGVICAVQQGPSDPTIYWTIKTDVIQVYSG